MKMIRIVSLLGFASLMFVRASFGQSVQADFDKSFDFSTLKTFSFAIQKRSLNDPLRQDSLNDGRIRTTLESKLLGSGFRLEGSGTPDFAVAYYVTTKNKFDLQDYGYGPPRWFGRRDIRVDQYTEGTLTVDLIDATTNQLVWRGRASGMIELKNMDKKINEAVGRLVKKFLKDTSKKGHV